MCKISAGISYKISHVWIYFDLNYLKYLRQQKKGAMCIKTDRGKIQSLLSTDEGRDRGRLYDNMSYLSKSNGDREEIRGRI